MSDPVILVGPRPRSGKVAALLEAAAAFKRANIDARVIVVSRDSLDDLVEEAIACTGAGVYREPDAVHVYTVAGRLTVRTEDPPRGPFERAIGDVLDDARQSLERCAKLYGGDEDPRR